jgi:branched-chain amino acid transport system permease protein
MSRFTSLAFPAVLAALCAVLPFAGLSDFYVQQAFLIFFDAALAQSWNILGGYTGYLSFGHSAFLGIGGYTVGVLYFLFGWSPFATFPLGAVVAGLLALGIGALCFRLRGSYFLIATMLVIFILQSLALNLDSITNGAAGIDMPLFTDDFRFEGRLWYYCGLVMLILASSISIFIERSAFGLSLMAIREDEAVACSMGVRTVRYKAIAFVVSAALAGLLGAAYAFRAHIVEPMTAFSIDFAAAPVLMSILGGSRNWYGPIVGAVIFQVISMTLTLSIGNEYSDVVFALFLILVVLFLPQGITGTIRKAYRARSWDSERSMGEPAGNSAR